MKTKRPGWYTTEEVAVLYGINPRTAVRRGENPVRRDYIPGRVPSGRGYLWKKAVVDEHLSKLGQVPRSAEKRKQA